ncbi:N(5)-(carboxyethyl)ornithine synthase [Symbiopectobacterium purcellii]|uniref:N(5)-(Carboxyethyl)ornithine synthase n=1 Tax=Symbiopectobacterium purcellii TaxID=2871826 RepID=A0ABX9ASR8_9ENTR|nr:N(5)-(carboxyethyl)ornithine synthase [Symbiopectobacterium purcellii]QZN97071.1 N(5)-(carboxyethyl)ornithine synthase [Symbiopectobacterium purcellii]
MGNFIGVFGTSSKKFENRIPLHPALFSSIPGSVKKNLIFESGYGEKFGITDDFFSEHFAGVATREQLFSESDVFLLPKPELDDFKFFSEGKILWGWAHCVQGVEITSAAIASGMTIIAWEAMYGGKDHTHIFYRNNELAGYAAVQHMMMLTGKTGYFGKNLKAAVLGFGATARGAINSLRSLGINEVTVYSNRPSYLINAPIENVSYFRIIREQGKSILLENQNGKFESSSSVLSDFDIIVNCVLQDTMNPMVFITEADLIRFKRHVDIIDISCDKGMGFSFAQPTSFAEPVLKIANLVRYYCVDHTPTLYWDSASYEITKSILDFLPDLVHNSWMSNSILSDAVEIHNGHIKNEKIISFQERANKYPHKLKYE